MEIVVEQLHAVAVVACQGSLDASTIAGFKERTQALLDQDVRYIVLDASQLTFIDSMGLGVIISLLRKVKAHGGDVKVAAPTPDVRSIFEITRLNRLFDVCTTRDDACERCTA